MTSYDRTMAHLYLPIAASALCCLAGCATAAPTARPAVGAPPFAVELKPVADGGPGRVVAWSARVRTGGFTLTTDRVVVDGATIRVFATLESPAPDAIVAQAFATLGGESNVGDPRVTTAELSVRRVARGTAADLATYDVVATAARP